MGIKEWTDTVKHVVDQYNDHEHATTKVAPNDAAYAKYEDVVRKNIEENATFDRKYDKVKKDDQAQVYKKPGKYSEFGFDFEHWLKGTRTVEGFDEDGEGRQTYKLAGIARPLMRHELRVVKGSEAPTLIRRRLAKKASPKYDVRLLFPRQPSIRIRAASDHDTMDRPRAPPGLKGLWLSGQTRNLNKN